MLPTLSSVTIDVADSSFMKPVCIILRRTCVVFEFEGGFRVVFGWISDFYVEELVKFQQPPKNKDL